MPPGAPRSLPDVAAVPVSQAVSVPSPALSTRRYRTSYFTMRAIGEPPRQWTAIRLLAIFGHVKSIFADISGVTCPDPLSPQHTRAPSDRRAHACNPPVLTDVYLPVGGEEIADSSSPQQASDPSARSAQKSTSPASMAVKVPLGAPSAPSPRHSSVPSAWIPHVPDELTATSSKLPVGVSCGSFLPFQHTIVPLARMAQAWL